MARDSFEADRRTPTEVRKVEIILDVEDGPDYAGRYSFDVLDQDGKVMDVRAGDLVPHLTTAQIDGLKAFLDDMLVKAKGVLPENLVTAFRRLPFLAAS